MLHKQWNITSVLQSLTDDYYQLSSGSYRLDLRYCVIVYDGLQEALYIGSLGKDRTHGDIIVITH